MYLDNRGTNALLKFLDAEYRQPPTPDLRTKACVDLKTDSVFSRYIKIDLNKDIIEVPIIAKEWALWVMKHNFFHPSNEYSSFYFPMYVSRAGSNNLRSFSQVIVSAFSTFPNTRLRELPTNKNALFYGGTGILLDKEFEVLLLSTIRLKKEDNVYRLLERKVYVGKDVFKNEDIVCKNIRKKFIPDIFEVTTYCNYTSTAYFTSTVDIPTKIEIADMSNYFVHPAAPVPKTCSDKQINAFLLEHLDDLDIIK